MGTPGSASVILLLFGTAPVVCGHDGDVGLSWPEASLTCTVLGTLYLNEDTSLFSWLS